MRILALETSSAEGSAALLERGQVSAQCTYHADSDHAERLLPRINALIEEARWSRDGIDLVAVGVGPGSFTGLRVGIALALGIGAGLEIPVFGVPSLQSVAGGVSATQRGLRVPVVDARRSEFFVAAYDEDGTEVAGAEAIAQTGLAEWLAATLPPGRDVVFCGDSAEAAVHAFPAGQVARDLRPQAVITGLLAEQMRAMGVAPSDHIAPLYVRDADAKLPDLPRSPLSLPRS